MLNYLADNIGSLFPASNISKYLKSQRQAVTYPNGNRLLHRSLAGLFPVQSVPRADIQGLKIFEIGEGKYYFEDLGIRNAICGINPLSDIPKVEIEL